jgi:hypothetical protein
MPQKKNDTKKGKGKSKKDVPVTSAKDTTEIVCIVDRSGSMSSIRDDAIGGFNNFLIEQQKEPGKATMTIILFDHEYQVVCSGKPVEDCKPFNTSTYVPRGSTALLDATGKAINEMNQRNPKKAIIVILTDGQENSSQEFTKQQIKAMISDCEGKGYAVIYLSADANAFEDGKSFGLSPNNITTFTKDQRGANVGTMAASYAIQDYRRTGCVGQSMSCYSARAGNTYDSHYPRQYDSLNITTPLHAIPKHKKYT